jgi:Uma2 family endonuclease
MSTTKTIPRPNAAPSRKPSAAAEERGVVRGASWDLYDRLTDAMGESGAVKVAYDGKDMEIMVVGPIHERRKELLSLFVHEVSFGLQVDCDGYGSTTWKRPELDRGIESDLCYYFDPAKIRASGEAGERDSNNVADYPNPDLAIEIDYSPPKIDRPGIYAAIRVPEVWRFQDEKVSIENLGPDWTYATVSVSRFLFVRAEEVTRWVIEEKSTNRRDWIRRLREWIQTDLKPRVEPR